METVELSTRAQWRDWLNQHHATKTHIWLVADFLEKGRGLSSLDSVEEALCFGWIDGIAKKFDSKRRAQRFSPRRPKSHWTELNKERARRLIREGRMTQTGEAALPDLSVQKFVIAEDIVSALDSAPGARAFFDACPSLYQRVRIGYVEEQRRVPKQFMTRLQNLVKQSAAKKMFGNWDDSGLRRTV
jgi:uncharacterized protein YdeI (YjbR/CyaY-like superfamily)